MNYNQLTFLETHKEDELKEYKKLDKIYGKGVEITPVIPSKNATPNDRKRYLPHLFPLEMYDNILVGFSGGKDSVCAVFYLLDLGVPKEKITLIHHDIDGEGNPKFRMDWAMTKQYCIQFAKAFGLEIKFSWREGGFAGELFRIGASNPISFEDLTSDKVIQTYGANWHKSKELEKEIEKAIAKDDEEQVEELMGELKKLGYRMKFPAKSASLSTRWCSSALKIEVNDRLIRYATSTAYGSNVLFIDGIRREESTNRSRYNEMELHATHAAKRAKRIVHHWRPIIEWDEEMVWAMFKKYRVRPHLAYSFGWSRCSCSFCIFSLPKHFKGLQELFPEDFNKMVELEKELNFTIDNKKDLISYMGDTPSCLPQEIDAEYIRIMRTGEVPEDFIVLKDDEEWQMPLGAYQGAEGGPC